MSPGRGPAPGLATPHPLGALLPSVYQDDDFVQRFTAGLDDVLAPVLSVLDCLDAYVDPALAPEDFVAWLEGWAGLERDEDVPLERRRAMVASATAAYRMHGTARGIAATVRALTGAEPAVRDTGGATWSISPVAAPPEPAAPEVVVTVPPGLDVDLRAIDRAVAAAKPAHVPHRVEVAS